jgi:putative zinc finger protein
MNIESNHQWADRLSDFLDGQLAPLEHEAVAEHLETCGECRGTLEELRHVVAQASGLGPITPPRDLWRGIAAAIQAPVGSGETQVIALPSAGAWRGETRNGRRSLSLSFPQLAAASVALMLVSASITYVVGPGVAVRDMGQGVVASPFGVTAVSTALEPPPALSQELAALESVLAEAGATLDAETLDVLQTNLGVIERAIEDSHRALSKDPANDFLMEHLERSYERKLDFLREAAQIVSWAS